MFEKVIVIFFLNTLIYFPLLWEDWEEEYQMGDLERNAWSYGTWPLEDKWREATPAY